MSDDPRAHDRQLSLVRAGLDRPADESSEFAGLVRVARRALDVPTATFTTVGDDRQIFVEQIGLYEPWAAAGETPLHDSLCHRVVRTGRPWAIESASSTPELVDHGAVVDAGVEAYLGVPVRDADGLVVGALCAMDSTERTWSEDNIATLEDLAAAAEVELRLRRTSTQLQHRLEHEAMEHDVDKAMSIVAAAMSRSWTVDDVAAAITTYGERAVGASGISLGLRDGNHMRYQHGPGVDMASVSVPIDADLPMAHALRTGETVWLDSDAAFRAFPSFDRLGDPNRVQSFAAMPIGSDEIVAVLGIAWTTPQPGQPLPRAVERLADLTSRALERAQSHQQAVAHAELLESLVLPRQLPLVPGIDLHGVYRSPADAMRVGGDLYDVVVRPDERVALIIADTAGHDLDTARTTARARHAIGLALLEGAGPAEALGRVNRYLLRGGGERTMTVTAAIVLLDLEASRMTVASAGHPQPRLLTSGEVRAVGPIGDPLLGAIETGYRSESLDLEEDDALVLFTDGLIERRGVPLTDGESRLHADLAALQGIPAIGITDHLLRSMAGDREDDVALLVARVMPADDRAPAFMHERPASRFALSDLRTGLSEWMNGHPRADDVLLVATELATNARRHSAAPEMPVLVTASLERNYLVLAVENAGEPFAATPLMPNTDSIDGRGLPIAAMLADLSVVEPAPGRTRVSARFHTDAPPDV